MMRIYFNDKLIPEGVPLLPLVRALTDHVETDPTFVNYAAAARSIFERTKLSSAELAILPFAWEHALDLQVKELAFDLANEATRAGKTIVIFFWSDSDEVVPVDGSLIFRTSMYRSSRQANEFAMPSWNLDLIEDQLDGKLPIRPKQEIPVVGFCGFAGYRFFPKANPAMLLRSMARRVKHRQFQPTLRERALEALAQYEQIETNFLMRERFFAGAANAAAETRLRVRHEFVQNIVNSDYTLCARGGGNYSYRLYETLSCGRIPIFIDTDCVLPYDFILDWREFCVWIPSWDVENIGRRVRQFHDALSDNDFETLQKRARAVWEEWIRPEGFFQNLGRHFEAERSWDQLNRV